VKIETWEKIPIGSACHCGGEGIIVVFIKSSTVWSAGDKCFSLTALWNPDIIHPA